MHKILIKTKELIEVIDKSDIIANLVNARMEVTNNKYLISLINEGKDNCDSKRLMEIKKELFKNSDYKKYMDNYNKLFYIVLKINNNYKYLLNERSCGK